MNQGGNSNLPPNEVLEIIFRYLTPAELSNVCVANHRIMNIARLLLYNSIKLSSDNRSLGDTLRLLSRERELGSTVRSALLRTIPHHQSMHQPWIQPSIFRNWKNLKSLKLIGYPYSNDVDRRSFQAFLVQNCTLLAQITFIPNADLEIAGIRDFQWGIQNSEPT